MRNVHNRCVKKHTCKICIRRDCTTKPMSSMSAALWGTMSRVWPWEGPRKEAAMSAEQNQHRERILASVSKQVILNYLRENDRSTKASLGESREQEMEAAAT